MHVQDGAICCHCEGPSGYTQVPLHIVDEAVGCRSAFVGPYSGAKWGGEVVGLVFFPVSILTNIQLHTLSY